MMARSVQRLARLAAQLQPAPAATAAASSVVQLSPAPRPGVSHPRRFAATDPVEEQAAFFTTHGYCFVEGALAGEELKAAQDAYERHAPPTREAWQRAHEAGTRQADVGTYGNTNALMQVDLGPGYGMVDVKNLPDHSWDIPRVAELDDAFVKLAEVPSLMPLLFKVMGPDLELMQINLRTSPGGQQPGQNRGWHRQVPRLLSHCPLAFVHARAAARRDMESLQDGWSHPTLSSRVKIFTYLWDVAPNGGMTGIVPDSFRRPDNPQTAGLDPTKDPPGAMVIGAKAGSAMVFDIHSWHAGTPNESAAPRTYRHDFPLRFARKAEQWSPCGQGSRARASTPRSAGSFRRSCCRRRGWRRQGSSTRRCAGSCGACSRCAPRQRCESMAGMVPR